MTVKELIAKLQTLPPGSQVRVRYNTNVQYSDLTSGTEDRVGDLEAGAIFPNGKSVMIAADLCDCE